MPKNKKEELLFATIMCFLMVTGMSAYNLWLHNDLSFQNLIVGFIPGFVVAFLLDNLVVGVLAKKITFSLPIKLDKEWKIIFLLTCTMIIGMVTCMSLFGLAMKGQLNGDIISKYFRAWGLNFIMALPLQVIIVGPISRYILKQIQKRKSNI